MRISDRPESSAERWILTQVNAGEDADLKKHFTGEAERIVDATFIGMLLRGMYEQEAKVWPYGVHISNARIVGTLNLGSQEIGYDTSFNDCVFQNDVFLNKASFKGSLNLDRTTFESTADFHYLTTLRLLSLQKTVFNGPTHFYRINIGDSLIAERAEFNETKEGVSFEGMKVGGYVFLWHATFKGPARFYGANVTDNFEADDAVFQSSKSTNFQNMRISGHALFRRTTFNGPVSFNSTTVGGSFETGDSDGGAHFNAAVDFSNVTADAVGFPKTFFSGSIVLNGMKYQRLSTSVPQNLLIMLNSSNYDSGAYAELEEYCRSIGDLDRADEVYVHKRRRERVQLSMGSQFGNLMLDWMVGYGRRPWRTLFWGALVVVGACFIFRKSKMQARNQENEQRHYSAFLYSLDLLLPIVDLQSASTWTPKAESRLARRYLPIHVITGWILVTILAATLTGILK